MPHLLSSGPLEAVRPGAAQPDPAQLTERLIARHGQALLRFLNRLTNGDSHRAEDIYQETLVRAWRHPESCLRCLAEGPQWLYTIARHVSIDQLRAGAIRPALVADDEALRQAADPVDYVARDLVADEVRAALAALNPKFRDVLREVYLEDRPIAEVAIRLGIPAGTVKSRTYYALRALKDALAERGLDRSLALCA